VEVTLLERDLPDAGASERNGGCISMITRSAGPHLEPARLSRELYPSSLTCHQFVEQTLASHEDRLLT
jgi:hypothetical protein